MHYLRDMGLIFKDEPAKPLSAKTARLRSILLSAPPALLGLFALILLAHDGLLGGLNRQKAMGLLSAAVVCGGLIALIFGISSKKMALQEARTAKEENANPWLRRADWANGRILSTERKPVLLVWIIVIFWCVVLAVLALLVLPPQLKGSHFGVPIGLFFAGVAVTVLVFTWNTTQAWRRLSKTMLMMEPFPAGLGGVLAGSVEARTTLQPEHGWRMRLSCVRRTSTGAGSNRRITEKVMWRSEQWLRGNLLKPGMESTRIPVYFQVPETLPESAAVSGDGIHWKLEIYGKLRGPDFQAVFEVPVFKLAELPAVVEDQTKPYQVSLEQIRLEIESRIEVKPLPDGGKEFSFPAGRNPGFATGATVVCVIWTLIVGLLDLKHDPLPAVLVFSVIDLLMAAFVLDLWLRRSHVAVNPGGVTVRENWLSFKRERTVPAGEVKMITAEAGATAGHVAYYDLKVLKAGGKEVVLAKHLKHQPEAEWLARQMQGALKPVS